MNGRHVVLLGAGGHAKVVADIFLDAGFEIPGCICPENMKALEGIRWLGDDVQLEGLASRGLTGIHVAIGDNLARCELARRAVSAGLTLVTALSRNAVVSRRAHIGNGVSIMPGAIVNSDAFIDDGVILNTGSSVDHDCAIGAYAHIAPGCHLAGKVTVGEGAFLGVGVSVVPGVTIGAWSITGAGAVITRDIAPGVTAVGVPARVIRMAAE